MQGKKLLTIHVGEQELVPPSAETTEANTTYCNAAVTALNPSRATSSQLVDIFTAREDCRQLVQHPIETGSTQSICLHPHRLAIAKPSDSL